MDRNVHRLILAKQHHRLQKQTVKAATRDWRL